MWVTQKYLGDTYKDTDNWINTQTQASLAKHSSWITGFLYCYMKWAFLQHWATSSLEHSGKKTILPYISNVVIKQNFHFWIWKLIWHQILEEISEIFQGFRGELIVIQVKSAEVIQIHQRDNRSVQRSRFLLFHFTFKNLEWYSLRCCHLRMDEKS